MAKQRIENVINDVLKDDAKKLALEFVAYLQANEIPIDESENYWDIKYKDKSVCFIWIDGSNQKPGPWTIWSDQEPGTWVTWVEGEKADSCKDFSVNEDIKTIAWENVNFCENCGGDCSPGKQKTILGKAFENVCSSAIAFTNPNAGMVKCAKEMVRMRKNDILAGE
jgi:hypothetical protein